MTSASPRKDPVSGTWWFVVDVGSVDGRRRQAKRRGFPTKKAAQEELDRLRVSVTKSTYRAPSKETFGDYLARWLRQLPTTGLRSSTVDGYRRNVDYVSPRLRGVR